MTSANVTMLRTEGASTQSTVDGPKYHQLEDAAVFVNLWVPIGTVILGIPGNIIALLVTLKKDNRRISTCCYMAGLAAVDTCVLITVTLYKVLVAHGIGDGLHASLPFLSYIWYGVDAFAITSGLFLAEMSIDRALAVLYPMKAPLICTPRKAVKVIVITASIQLVYHIQIFFTYKLSDPPNGAILRDIPEARWAEDVLGVYRLIFGTIAPFSILVVSNSLIILGVRRAAVERKKIGNEAKTKGSNLTILLLMTSFAYLICSCPKRIYEALAVYDLNDPYWSARYWLEWWVFTELWHMNFAINFYVYFLGGGRKFRNDSKEIIMKLFFCRKSA